MPAKVNTSNQVNKVDRVVTKYNHKHRQTSTHTDGVTNKPVFK